MFGHQNLRGEGKVVQCGDAQGIPGNFSCAKPGAAESPLLSFDAFDAFALQDLKSF
jgi:hypothetical protein